METYQEHDARLSAEHDAALDAWCDVRMRGVDERDIVRLTRRDGLIVVQTQNLMGRTTVVMSTRQALTLANELRNLTVGNVS